ncbi:hypothetical protein [Bradyrhizobium sp. SRL28]|uniref:hypothetical protein n=1 Tax=Bradyrhizobium sp. SRL28 TaxID=2836178 RepID=UPI00201CA3B9|nr:hypothetical protein [Bradyrhizobium sp. SRL28]
MKDFYGDEIEHIAAKPQQYSLLVSSKPERAAQVAYDHGRKSGSENARYFSYQLGNKSVGLLRTEGGASMSDVFKEEKARARWREQFSGRTELTSTVDFGLLFRSSRTQAIFCWNISFGSTANGLCSSLMLSTTTRKPAQRRWVLLR